ncbi:hypothetical protein MRX96_056404 [Rhipicephalus microplus]
MTRYETTFETQDLTRALQPWPSWGPKDPDTRRAYEEFLAGHGITTGQPVAKVTTAQPPSEAANVLVPVPPVDVVARPPVAGVPPGMLGPQPPPGDPAYGQPGAQWPGV